MSDSNRNVDKDSALAGTLALLTFICALLLILISTLKPFDIQPRPLTLVDYTVGYDVLPSSFLDFLRNIALFVPYGFSLAAILDRREWSNGRIRWAVLICGFLLTLAVESLQHFIPLRQPSLGDLVANTIGALVGFAGFRLWQNLQESVIWLHAALDLPRNILAVIVCYTLLILLMAYGLASSARFYDWQPDYRLLLGNEQTEDRVWHGSIRDLALYDRALETADARRLLEDPDFILSNGSGLLAYYPLAGGGIEHDVAGRQPDLIWRGVEGAAVEVESDQFDGAWLESRLPVTGLSEALLSSSQLTMRLTVATADLDQTGPARIVTISKDPLLRNLTLGQAGRDLVLRYRSFQTGENGTSPQFNFPTVFNETDPLAIVITYDGLTIKMINSQSEQITSFELLPGIAFFYRYINPILNMNPEFSQITAGKYISWVFHLLYYVIIFLPLGTLLAFSALQSWGKMRSITLLIGTLIIIPLLLELALVLPGGHSARPFNIAAGSVIIASVAFLIVPALRLISDRWKMRVR